MFVQHSNQQVTLHNLIEMAAINTNEPELSANYSVKSTTKCIEVTVY